jgi:hypothetical protein
MPTGLGWVWDRWLGLGRPGRVERAVEVDRAALGEAEQ